jgi:hypothetical protein
MYICPALRRVCIGEAVRFDPSAPIDGERARIKEELTERITALAEALPRHRVVPYRNIPRKDYPYNIPCEDGKI